MTSNHKHAEVSRRPGELGAHSTDHFNLIVPDLKVAQKFYASFGLDVREERNNLALYTTAASTVGRRPRSQSAGQWSRSSWEATLQACLLRSDRPRESDFAWSWGMSIWLMLFASWRPAVLELTLC